MKFSPLINRYKNDEGGQYAIMTAVLAMPLLIAASSALDMSSAGSERNRVKSALDNAVLAAATNNKITDAQKEALAKSHFSRNYDGRANVTTTASASNGIVRMSASGDVPVSISNAVGLKGINIKASSAASRSEKNVVCVLALAENVDDAINFTGDVEFLAPSCSVHSNSKSIKAINSSSSETPVALSFCATGGVSGSYSPYAKGECLPIDDPYSNTSLATITNCIPQSVYRQSPNRYLRRGVTGIAARLLIAGSDIKDSGNYTGDDLVLNPGTYCGGLTIDGKKVKFLPGDYIMKDGPLVFKNGAEAEADKVTFSFTGKEARLKIESGADVTVKAPNTGPRKGLAFMEMGAAKKPGKIGLGSILKDLLKKEPVEIANTISSGGNLNVLGTIYFPTQSIVVQGVGTKMGAQAPSTSFIAHTIDFDGDVGSEVTVNVDHRKAGLPPILPRAEDGAVLIE